MQKPNKSTPFALAVLIAIGVAVCPFIIGGPAGAAQSGEKIEKAEKPEIHPIASVDDLKQSIKDHDYLFVILPASGKATGSIKKAALAAVKKARDDEVHICVAELSRDCEGFSEFAKSSGVEKFPAVLAVKQDGKQKVVQGKITEKKLAKAYRDLVKAKASCPFADVHPNCDPKKCGFE